MLNSNLNCNFFNFYFFKKLSLQIWIEHKISKKMVNNIIFKKYFFEPYGDFSDIKSSIRNRMNDLEFFFDCNIIIKLKRSNLWWAVSWFLKKSQINHSYTVDVIISNPQNLESHALFTMIPFQPLSE